MLSILRFFAVCTMLLAFLMGLIALPAVYDAINAHHGATPKTDSYSSQPAEPTAWDKLALATRIDDTAKLLHSPAALFCTGGALFVLIRIARSQE
jgi:hypothetical protein